MRYLCTLTIITVIIIIGLHHNGVVFFEYEGKVEGNFIVEIEGTAKEKNYYNVYEGKIENKKFLIYISKTENTFSYGDKIKVTATFNKPNKARNSGGFDYSVYLKSKKIYGSFKVEKILEVEKAKKIPLINKIQEHIKETFNKNLKNSPLAIGLLLGIRDNISEDVQDDFKNANLTHMLAISGAHFSYVILIVSFICKKLKNKRLQQFILIGAIIFFMNLTGSTPSVVRAGIMSILLILSSILKRQNDIYTNISTSLLIQIINNPYVIFDVGLILSYSGVIGIVTFNKFFSKIIKNKIICVTLSANSLLIPIMIYKYNTISFTFVISNVLASGLLGVIIMLELIACIIKIKPIFVLLDISLSLLQKIANFCSKIPFSNVYVTTKTVFLVLAIYLIIFLVIKRKKKSIPIIILFIFAFTSLARIYNYNTLEKDILQIKFIDVGQGDCTLLINKGKTLMIDTGGSTSPSYDVGENIVHKYLLYKGINKIDYLMLSHFDADHCQGAIFLLKNMKVKNLIISIQPENSEFYEEITNICIQKNTNIMYVKKGNKFKIANLDIEILHPNNNFIAENKLNNNALVCKINYYNFKMLFTGDIEKIAESQLLDEELSADLLKVGHHGSKTSTTQEFLNKVNPQIALIGVGENNKFGHPNDDVIKRLQEKGVKIFRTDLNGEINININKNGKVNTKTMF